MQIRAEQHKNRATVTEVPSIRYFKFLLGFDLRQDLQRNLSLIINHSGAWICGLLNFCQESVTHERAVLLWCPAAFSYPSLYCLWKHTSHITWVLCKAWDKATGAVAAHVFNPVWNKSLLVGALGSKKICFQVSSLTGNMVTNFSFSPLNKLVIAISLKWFLFIGTRTKN